MANNMEMLEDLDEDKNKNKLKQAYGIINTFV
jgi:hypothetical protein